MNVITIIALICSLILLKYSFCSCMA